MMVYNFPKNVRKLSTKRGSLHVAIAYYIHLKKANPNFELLSHFLSFETINLRWEIQLMMPET